MLIDQLYSDFTNNLLPKIQEGLEITKDYFLDLFGRYRNYLIITDGLKILLGFGFAGLFLFFLKKAIKWVKGGDYDSDLLLAVVFGLIFLLVPACVLIFQGAGNITKDIFIPEIRMMEIIKSLQE